MVFKKISLLCCILLLTLNTFATTYHDLNNKPISAQAMQGKWVIINYWAAWCPACRAEVPEFNAFYHDNHDTKVLLYGVNYDRLQQQNLQDAVSQIEIEFPVLQEDPLHQLDVNAIDVLPTTYIVNPQGEVVKTLAGPTTAQDLQNTLEDLLRTPPPLKKGD